MEGVYDHIQESTLPTESDAKATEPEGTLNQDLAEAYNTFAASPWGARIGGFFGSVRKQGESIYAEVSTEAASAGQDALKGFTDLRTTLVNRARSMSSSEAAAAAAGEGSGEGAGEAAGSSKDAPAKDGSTDATADVRASDASDSGFIDRFRAEASKRLRDIQQAEEAADEALLKFGANVRDFFRDAVTVTGPAEGEGDEATSSSKVLFESKDADGRKVIHTSRFDAQLHVIHCSLDSFSRDPASPEWAAWTESFSVNDRTDDVARDLTRYDELARAMERLVPETVPYETFWKRYYFLRMVVESEEKRRREMLKGAIDSSADAPSWDDDSDEENAPSTPQPGASTTTLTNTAATPQAKQTANTDSADSLKPAAESRSSHDHEGGSTAGSDTSYDIVSGTTSRAAGSPREESKKLGQVKEGDKQDESDEDWE